MRSPPERRRVAALLAAALALGGAACAASDVRAAEAPAPLSAAAVEAAAAAVRADPDLGGKKKERIWRFKPSASQPVPSEPPSGLAELARWLAEGGRALVWLLGAAALAAVVVAARRWWAVRGQAAGRAGARLPSHVRELDIRPESLPADIGAGVRALWLAGEHRAALSLLYRGALSRLVHAHAVPIGAAATEGDCVRLARAGLAPASGDFVAALVQAWQLAVYGGRALSTPQVLALCDDFDRRLPAAAAAAVAAR